MNPGDGLLSRPGDGGPEAASQRVLTFFLDGRSYGLPLAQVAEISPLRPLNRLPHMPRAVEGILELRGRVVPIMNLRERMSLPPLEADRTGTILVLDLAGTATGLLVDGVDAVISVQPEALVTASPMLAGLSGAWALGFIALGERLITILDAATITNLGGGHGVGQEALATRSLEERLDEDLRHLIDMAPSKDAGQEQGRILPQIESSITYTEQEMGKVMNRVEAMLAGTDRAFKGIGYLKHEVGLGKLPNQEKAIVDLERTNQELEDTVFVLIQQMQYQDIARQKLERVMVHLKGMQGVISGKLRTPA